MKKFVLITVMVLISACAGSYEKGELENLGKCLSEKDAKMYGAFWCPSCAKQKKILKEGFKYVNYVECDPKGDNPQTELCLEKGVEKYPDWEFADGTRLQEKQDPETLAEASGCPVPKRK